MVEHFDLPLANKEHSKLCSSEPVEEIKTSALSSPASNSELRFIPSPLIPITSFRLHISFKRSASQSTTVTSWSSDVREAVRLAPVLPPPTIIIFIFSHIPF